MENNSRKPEISHDIELKIPFGQQGDLEGDHSSQLKRLSAASFAYIGDAVYELFVRTHFLLPPMRNCDYHDKVVKQVRAEGQILSLEKLRPYLTQAEEDILRWGRNGSRRVASSCYREASSLETLVGYLYLNNPQRLYELLLKLNLGNSIEHE